MAIGIYDSGVGGLSVWKELCKSDLPLIYFGDTAHAPYGEKTFNQLSCYFRQIEHFFADKGCQGIIIACNTASALLLPKLETRLPALGIISAGVEACLQACQGRLGILATQATQDSQIYQTAFLKARPHWEVYTQSAPRLAPLVEKGAWQNPLTKKAAFEYLRPLLNKKIDTLLLGCTHYSFLHPLFRDLAYPQLQIVDPAPTMAQHVHNWLAGLNLAPTNPRHEFWVSSNPLQFQQSAQKLLAMEIPAVKLHRLTD